MIGVFVGRFQPFHNGHMWAIEDIIRDNEDLKTLLIVIGSSNQSHNVRNPFTSGERWSMIRKAINEIKYYSKGDINMEIFQIPDAGNGNVWRQQIIDHLPDFDIMFASYGETSRLFKELGYKVRNYKYHGVELGERWLSGTNVRHAMENIYEYNRQKIELERQWFEMVPATTMITILEIDGVNRIREINGKEPHGNSNP